MGRAGATCAIFIDILLSAQGYGSSDCRDRAPQELKRGESMVQCEAKLRSCEVVNSQDEGQPAIDASNV